MKLMSNRSDPTGAPPAAPATPFALEHFLPYRLSVLTNTVSRALSREYRSRFDIGVLEWRVLAVVGRFQPMSAGEVAERTAMDKVAVSRAVAGLLEKRLLRRRPDGKDRRRGVLRLSARGSSVHDRIAKRATQLERSLCAPLSAADRKHLSRLLDALGERAGRLDRFGVPSAD